MRILALLMLAVLLASCGGRVDRDAGSFVDRNLGKSTIGPSPKAELPQPSGEIVAQGTFRSDRYSGSGEAALLANATGMTLVLHDFQSERGTNMRLYLAADRNATDYIDLGPLQGYNGNYTYPVPSGTKHRTVLVWNNDIKRPYLWAALQ
jgi:hypothetical protein